MIKNYVIETPYEQKILDAADAAGRLIPPVWPLASSVAVNPYLGQSGETLAQAGTRLSRVAGTPVTMPREWYHAKITAGDISDDDLAAAIKTTVGPRASLDVLGLKAQAATPSAPSQLLPTLADLAGEAADMDWTGFIAERFGTWAAAWFDDGQALWAPTRTKGAWKSWCATATHDLTPEIMGLDGFGARVDSAPDASETFILYAVDYLGLTSEMLETYFHQLLFGLGGWAQYARYNLWTAELNDQPDHTLTDFLAIRLFWEVALFDQFHESINESWQTTKSAHAKPLVPSDDLLIDAVLQTAAEHAAQRDMETTFAKSQSATHTRQRPSLQAAFCIDVRSEVFRRSLEAVNPQIETLGFAGFFGLATSHRRFASDVEELKLPVLLTPGVHSCSGGTEEAAKDKSVRYAARAVRAWGRFKLAAVSSFAFVESAGPIYIAKLLLDAFGISVGKRATEPAPRFDPPLDLDARTKAAESILKAMSFTDNFARLVLLAGHGATVVNNPHASALHCGACGGYSGEVNARLLAVLLNDPDVRAQLAGKGIKIPEDTLFLGALHCTTTDKVTIYVEDHNTINHKADLQQARDFLAQAGRAARNERAERLPRAKDHRDIIWRSRNWSEVRPEWALAGCQAFIAAPRSRTSGSNLNGRAFLHNYDWRQDSEFGVLELIMTAPVVVASWISLQYYGSAVSPDVFGGGNKLLHNITGGMGVVEGNGGTLRAGLPWQSVHDGEHLVHDPLRLSVVIEAPKEAMNDILKRHEGVRVLFDNQWLHLFALDDQGRMASRYDKDLVWRDMTEQGTVKSQLEVV